MSFFESKKAAAILKHAILNQYVDPFVSKTGSTSQDHRVAIIDGYAGEGRYENGDEGSPTLLISKARRLAPGRTLECYFVEENKETCEKLLEVVNSEGEDLSISVIMGKIEDNLDTLMSDVEGIPVLVFLDPYGLMIPFDTALKVFNRSRAYGAPATEMLINFNAGALRRIAGHLTSATPNAATLARMDNVCGGDWWRTTWLSYGEDKDGAEEAVVSEYARKLAAAAKCGSWSTDVRNRANLKPVYHLVFLSRHPDGMSVFGEALSLGLQRWREEIHRIENEDSLFDDDESFKASERALEDAWIKKIEENLRALLAQGSSFTILSKYAEVFGDTLGLAREKHLRAAWKKLYSEGATATDSKGKLLAKRIDPA
jgi:three-Cys-motif partner protein